MKHLKISENDYNRIFVVSDLHGALTKFETLWEELRINKSDLLIICGDSLDRGEKSLELFESIIHLVNNGFQIIHLLGNHEKMFYDYMVLEENKETYLFNGGEKTAKAYKDYKYINNHLDFIEQMPLIVETENYIIVHAGLRPNVDLIDQKEEDLIWIKHDFLDKDLSFFRKKIIHGHSINSSGKIFFRKNGSISIDCGGYVNNRIGVLEIKKLDEFYF